MLGENLILAFRVQKKMSDSSNNESSGRRSLRPRRADNASAASHEENHGIFEPTFQLVFSTLPENSASGPRNEAHAGAANRRNNDENDDEHDGGEMVQLEFQILHPSMPFRFHHGRIPEPRPAEANNETHANRPVARARRGRHNQPAATRIQPPRRARNRPVVPRAPADSLFSLNAALERLVRRHTAIMELERQDFGHATDSDSNHGSDGDGSEDGMDRLVLVPPGDILARMMFDMVTHGLFAQAAADQHLQGQPPASSLARQALKQVLKISNSQLSRSPKCMICMDDFNSNMCGHAVPSYCQQQHQEQEDSGFVVEMPCRHIYHRSCLFEWLSRSNQCPTCRYEIMTENVDYNRTVTERMAPRDREITVEVEKERQLHAAALEASASTSQPSHQHANTTTSTKRKHKASTSTHTENQDASTATPKSQGRQKRARVATSTQDDDATQQNQPSRTIPYSTRSKSRRHPS